MTYASVRSAAQEIAKRGSITPHQLAALTRLDERLKGHPEIVEEFTAGWRAAGSPAAAAPAKASSTLLKVPYEYQLDNASGTGYRECFSSSCAMVARFYGKVKSDDEYNAVRARYGDTTSADAQIKALRALGLSGRHVTNASQQTLEREIRAGRPVPVGWLHKGPVTRPSGGGHWSVVIGFTDEAFIHNDPNGDADLVNGGYVRHSGGAGIAYSRRNWCRRWEVDGPSTGWAMLIQPA